MNKASFSLFLLVFFVPLLGVSSAQLPANPSFEDPETELENLYGDLAEHWGRWGAWMNRETAWAPTHSGVGMIGYHHWQIESSDDSGLYQDLPDIPAGQNLTFTVFAYKDRDTNATFVEMRLEKLGGFEILATQTYSMEHLKTAEWTSLSVSGRSAGPGVRIVLVVRPAPIAPRKGAIKFDDALVDIE